MIKRSKSRYARVPSHIALIPDGNRRWSGLHKLALFSGYDRGIKKFIDFSNWARELGVKTITVWALSTDNIRKRSAMELGALYGLYVKAANDPEIMADLKKNGARIRVIGNLDMLPAKVKKALVALEARTRAYRNFTINMLIGYGGREDIMYAFSSAKAQGKKVTEDYIGSHIRTADIPTVDLIIRTSGEMRLSGFLPWQSNYSELYFAKKYWPDFGKQDLEKAVRSFSERGRRFGR